jgi:hypothetical protein
LAKRTEFLKVQRDKLLAMKKTEREKQLAEIENQHIKSRPKSARAARLVPGVEVMITIFCDFSHFSAK